jgi:LruC domain-containing protein
MWSSGMPRFSSTRTLALVGAASLLASSAAAQPLDSDGDGVVDAADTYPCDPSLAGLYGYPAQGEHGALLFEDQWPALGDADFNDAVITYSYLVRTDAADQVVSFTATFNVLALGGDYDNGLGLHLPIPASQVASVTRTVGSGAAQALTPEADAELTVAVSTHLRELFGFQAGPINVTAAAPLASPPVRVDVVLSSPIPAAALTSQAPYDVYLFRSADPRHQIHRSGFGGTATMNTALFHQSSDRSNPSAGRYFVDARGLPFVLELPVFDRWTQEGVDIALLFPNVITFATSGGTQAADFYVSGVDGAHAYAGSPALQPGTIGAETFDTACILPRIVCDGFSAPDTRHCSGSALGTLDTNDYAGCSTFCADNRAGCCGFSDYGRHPNYSRPGLCSAYTGPVQSGCNGCTIRITYASGCYPLAPQCAAFTSPDSRSCSGAALGTLDTNDYTACRSFCVQQGAACCGFSDYGRHPNYSRPGLCTAYGGPVQAGCTGCTIGITYASACY